MSKPLLSIGMIVKDEIRCIERCLKALQPLRDAIPCELVIADTGSTDGTREVADRYADILFDFAWIDDFSAARNAVMDRCTGVWYLAVDADEYLDPDISQLVSYFGSENEKTHDFAAVIVRNYASRDMEHSEYTDFNAIRMLRMSTGLRYYGRIHEAWRPGDAVDIFLMQHVILHHDGYAEASPEYARHKAERNLALLRVELKENPDSQIRLLQCIEASSPFPHEKFGFEQEAMRRLIVGDFDPTAHMSKAMWRYAVADALQQNFHQAEEWLHWGEDRYAQSIYLRVDVAAFACTYYYNHEDYPAAIQWGQKYLDGMNDYRNNRYDLNELVCSALGCTRPSIIHQCKLIMVDSLIKLDQPQESCDLLESFAKELNKEEELKNCLRTLLKLEEHWETADRAEQLCSNLLTPILSAQPENKEEWTLRTACLLQIAQMFGIQSIKSWRLFRQLPGELGIAAQAMDTSDSEKLSAFLEQITRWTEVPNPLIAHVIETGVPMPPAFFRKGSRRLRNTAAAVAQSMPEFAYHMAGYPLPQADSFAELQFYYDLAAGALQLMAPLWDAGEQEKCRTLCGEFAGLAGKLLPRLYNPHFLDIPENWDVLPGMHQFGLWLWTAERAKAKGDKAGYIRALRCGLERAPRMKDMVEFLLEEAEKADASPELLELAEKVRAILAQYPPNDPSVADLKQSEVYQRVAYLIEGTAAPVFGGLPQ